MHGLLDRPAQLTNLKRETPCSEPLTCERQLRTRSPWRRRSCSLTGKPRNEQLLSPNDIARIGSGHEPVLRKPSQITDNSEWEADSTRPDQSILQVLLGDGLR